MIELNDVLSDRWLVKKPFLRGNGRNFVCFEVEDQAVNNRVAVLKTVRKTDLPSEPLYQWRCRALRQEIKRLGSLTFPFLAQPLDAEDPTGSDPYVVYSAIGQAQGNFLLRETLQRWGLRNRKKDGGECQIVRIARYMLKIFALTEELWQAGFVHANLNPDHLYNLRDGVIRVTGLSAICSRDGEEIRAEEPGLRNTTMGYQCQEQYELVRELERRPSAAARLPSLNAGRVRWTSYAALAFDLIWGRDLREYCALRGSASVKFDAELKQMVMDDFPSFFNAGPPIRKCLDELWTLLSVCFESGGVLPSDVAGQFRSIWEDLNRREFNHLLAVSEGERAWRRARWPEQRGAIPKMFPPARPGDEGEYVIETPENRVPTNSGRERAQYRVRNLAHPARLRTEMQHCSLSTLPTHHLYFLPGDIVPGRVHKVHNNGHPIVSPAGWLIQEEAETRRIIGQPMRALSLGRRHTSLHNWSLPWATVVVNGSLRTYPILPPTSDALYTVFPDGGRFFTVTFEEHPRYRFGVAPAYSPPLNNLASHHQFVTVREVGGGQAYFDMPLPGEPGYFVSCVLELSKYPSGEIARADQEIPIVVHAVLEHKIVAEWDHGLAGMKAAIGKEYDGRIVRRDPNGQRFRIQFGNERFPGVLSVSDRTVPWGIPFRSWDIGSEVTVRVTGRNPGRNDYLLEAVRAPNCEVEKVFLPGNEYVGRVAHYDSGNVVVYLEDSARGIGADGIVRYVRMNPSERRNPRVSFPLGTDIRCRVEEVIPTRRLLSVVPVRG